MKKIIALLNTSEPKSRSVGSSLSLVPSLRDSLLIGLIALFAALTTGLALMAIGVMAQQAMTTVTNWSLPNERINLAMGILDDTLLTPIIETALMLVPIRLLAKMRTPERFVPLISGVLWAIIHTKGKSWDPSITFIPFYFFTAQFLREQRYSVNRAWLTVSTSHAVYNTMLTLFQYFVFGPLTNTVSWI